jgi:protein-S-isoprenylcysteine O-methyltransferase Ste14
MRTLELRAPPPLVAAIFMFGMWLLPLFPEPALFTPHLRIALAALVVLIGQGIAVAGMIAFRRARTTINPVRASEASSLVSGGVYRFTRNPMYLGWALTLFAWALYLGNLLALTALPMFVWYITRFQIAPEERILLSLFGSEFVSYTAKVRRWV